MQCSNCRFENMPGVESCGRCGGSLRLATATIAVQPPRAGKWTKRLRKWSPRRQSFQVRDALAATVPRAGGAFYNNVPEGPLLMRLVVPGWAQLYCGRKLLGRMLLCVYVVCLVIALLFIGTQFGSIVLGLAIACHAASVVDIVNASTDALPRRVSIFLGYLVTVALVVYLPAGWVLTLVAVPRVIAADSPPFQPGDVVLYAPRAAGMISARPGQIVLYRLPNVVLSESHTQYYIGGERIDRILAGPGQHVLWRDGRLEVDGSPSAFVPVDLTQAPGYLDVTAPPGHFVILPSTLRVNRSLANPTELHRMSLIPVSEILGKVYWQQQPLSRIGWVH